MTTEEIKQYLTRHIISTYGTDPEKIDDSLLEEELTGGKVIQDSDYDEHRWVMYFTRIVKVGDKYFKFGYATCTGDNSLEECGYELRWDEVFEVEPVEEMTIVYKEVK